LEVNPNVKDDGMRFIRLPFGLAVLSFVFLSFSALTAAPQSPTEAQRLIPWKANGHWGYINAKGEWVISPRFSKAKEFQADGLAEAHIVVIDGDSPKQDGEKVGLINARGEWALSPVWEDARHPTANGVVEVQKDSLWRLVDLSGNRVSETSFRDLKGFSEGLALAWTGGLFGYVDERGAWAIPPHA
jgi:hypothetical protein